MWPIIYDGCHLNISHLLPAVTFRNLLRAFHYSFMNLIKIGEIKDSKFIKFLIGNFVLFFLPNPFSLSYLGKISTETKGFKNSKHSPPLSPLWDHLGSFLGDSVTLFFFPTFCVSAIHCSRKGKKSIKLKSFKICSCPLIDLIDL